MKIRDFNTSAAQTPAHQQVELETALSTKSTVGEANFMRMRKTKKFYVDKTMYAVALLSHERAVLRRPPRMGKSLFIDMVECLYDVRFKNEFNTLFDDLYVGKNKPKEANKFYVVQIVLPPRSHPDPAVYEKKFRQHVMDGIDRFLTVHPNVLEQLENSILFRQKYNNGEANRVLKQIANHVGPENLMVLVDEYDRAAMDYYSFISADDLDETDIARALLPVTGPLQDFMFTLKVLRARYYVTGIFTVDLGISIGNDNSDLSDDNMFAHAFGMTVEDVQNGLRKVAGVKDEQEEDRAIKFLHKAADGYNFFGATQPLFNPQLIHLFLNNYKTKGYKGQLPGQLFDHNQVWSTNELRIVTHTPELTRRLLNTCLSGEPFEDKIKTKPIKLHAETYLFQLGVLSLHQTGIDYDPARPVGLIVPNANVRLYYAEAFLQHMEGNLGSTCAFVADPTEDKLSERLHKLMQRPWTDHQTETDSQILLAGDIILNSPVRVGGEHHPGGTSPPFRHKDKFLDIKVLVNDKHIIIMEYKTVKAGPPDSNQRLHMDVSRDLGLVMTGEDKQYPQAGLRKLNILEMDQLRALGTKYQGKTTYASTVGQVHEQAITEVREYGAAEYEYQQSQDNPLPVFMFAITQVVNRCITTRVFL